MFRLPKCLLSWCGWLLSEIFWMPSRALALGPLTALKSFFINLKLWWRIERWRVGFLSPGVYRGGQIIRRTADAFVSFEIRLMGGRDPIALLFAAVDSKPVGVFGIRGARANPGLAVEIDTRGVPFRMASEADAEDVLAAGLPPQAQAAARQTLSWLHTVLS